MFYDVYEVFYPTKDGEVKGYGLKTETGFWFKGLLKERYIEAFIPWKYWRGSGKFPKRLILKERKFSERRISHV